MAMGFMQAAQFLGNSLGPLMGTVAVALVGFRGTFFIAAGVMLGLVGLTAVAVRERGATLAAIVASLIGIPITFLLAGLVALATGITSRWVIGPRPYTLGR